MKYVCNSIGNYHAKLDRTYLNLILCSKVYDKNVNNSNVFLNDILKRVLALEKSKRIVIMDICITAEETELICKNYYVPQWALIMYNND